MSNIIFIYIERSSLFFAELRDSGDDTQHHVAWRKREKTTSQDTAVDPVDKIRNVPSGNTHTQYINL